MTKPWSRNTRYLVLIISLIIFSWLFYQSRAVLGPLAISVLLAFILNPVVTFVHERAKIARSVVVLMVYLVSLAILGITSFITIQVLAEQTAVLTLELQAILAQIQTTYLSQPIHIFNYEFQPALLISETAGQTTTDFIQADVILQAFQATTTNLGWVLVVIVITYYLLLDGMYLRDWVLKWTPDSYEPDILRLYDELKWVWQQYMRGQLRVSAIVGFLTAVCSLVIGLPGAVVIGILSAVFNVLPSVGSTFVIVIAMAVALFTGSTTLNISNVFFAILVLAVLSLIQFAENIWFRPRIMSSTLNIHPAIVFTAIIASLALAGIITALIIVPVIVSMGIIAKYVYFKLFEMDPWKHW